MKKIYDIILTGIGVGGIEHTTQETLKALYSARVIYNLTAFHHQLSKYCKNIINLESEYWTGEIDEIVYKRIADIILKEARNGPQVVVVVDGHPTIYDDVSWDIMRRGKRKGFKVKIIPAISCIDAMAAYCNLEINASGLQIIEATSLISFKQKLNPNMDTLIMQIGWFGTSLLCEVTHSKKGRFIPLINYLLKFYPKTHNVQLLLAPTSRKDSPKIIKTKMYLLDKHCKNILPDMSLFIPALNSNNGSQINDDFIHKTEDIKHLKKIAAIKKNGG